VNGEADPVVDLGGCGGCGIACAVACSNEPEAAGQVRRTLLATGAAIAALALVPVAVGGTWLTAVGLVLVVLGATVSVLAGVALRAGPATGQAAVQGAYRLLPLALGGLLASWVAVAVGAVLG
jgi:hypothetical protein